MVMMLRLGINYVLRWTKDVAVERTTTTTTTELDDAAEACATVQVRRTALESACAQHRGGRQTRYPEEQRRRERSQREGEDKAEQSRAPRAR